MNHVPRLLALLAMLVASSRALPAQSIEETFLNPPDATRPWCYWYWISDNISRGGITKDLEAMARTGIGTALIGNQWFEDQPQGRIPVLSEEWWNLTVHAVREGKRLGVDIGLFNCPGWSQSGGPWIRPDQAMQYLVSAEKRVEGPGKFSGALPAPGEDFQDVVLLAIPAPQGEDQPLSSRQPKIDGQPAVEGLSALVDGDPNTTLAIPEGGRRGAPFQIDITAAEPFTARSIVLTPGAGGFRSQIDVQAWIDGEFKSIRSIKYDRRNPKTNVGPMPRGPVIGALPATTSARFRLVFSPLEGSGQLAEIDISPAARVEFAIEKQLGKVHPTPAPLWGDYLWPVWPEPGSASFVVDPAAVIQLTGKLGADGRLEWDVPEGSWIIQRVGMLPTGEENGPAAPNARGLEVDKLSREPLNAHFDVFVGELLRRLSPDERSAFKYVVADSYEVGPQNWTVGMGEVFEETYGYDPIPFLPALSGRVIESGAASDRFLWDLRRLVADLVADEYVAGLRELCVANNLQMWLENYGHWGFPGEFMRYGGECNLVSGEFWVTGTLGNIECRAAASTAHAYGKPIVYAEAFTSGDNWAYTPFDLKARGDWAFTEGINHFVLHLYIQQPSDDVPGMNAWFGTEFNRHNTWFGPGKDWFDYLRRCHVLLQQGTHVGDFAYFIGEDTPIMTGTRQPVQPAGFDFDYINAEVILERMDVRDGRWTLPDGKQYRILVLPPLETMRPAVLTRLAELVEKGGVLYGEAPLHSPSLQDWQRADRQVRQIAERLWQGLAAGQTGDRAFGKGRIFQGGGLERVVKAIGLADDVSGIDPKQVLWTHRQTPEMDVYFISSQNKTESVDIAPVLRGANGRIPEFWHADTGAVEVLGHFETLEHGTRVPLRLGPAGSAFVVFRDQTKVPGANVTEVSGPGRAHVTAGDGGWQADFDTAGRYSLERQGADALSVAVTRIPAPVAIGGPWKLQFPEGRDVPLSVDLPQVGLWTEHDNVAIKYFSGTATYQTAFDMPGEPMADDSLRFELDLGRVEPMARVILNGKDLGLLWKPPFRIDVTGALQPGRNTLELAVTNLWNNRLIGDLLYPQGFPGLEGKMRFHPRNSVRGKMSPNRPLHPSGLAGPIQIEMLRRIALAQ
jgi:hypothetical protein